MSSGVSKTRTGSVNGTGSAIEVRGVEFTPRKVELFNVDGLATGVWTDTMADGAIVKRVTNGTMTAPSSGGITPQADGFDIGTDSDLNASDELIHWVAHE